MLSAVRLSSVCLSVCLSVVCLLSVTLVHPTQAVELFGNFFSPYDSTGTLIFWCQKSLVGDAPFPLKFAFNVTHPLSNSEISTNIVIASEKSSISTYRKLTTRFPTSHRWTVYVTPKCPKGWHKNSISLFVPVKFNFSRKKSATKFLCMKTSSGKVVATSYHPMVHRSIAGDVPIYLKLAFKATHPFRKRAGKRVPFSWR